MAVIENWYNQDLQDSVKVHYLDGNMFSHNGNGNRIGVHVFNNGLPVTLTGTVSGYVVTSDGATVPCLGDKSGNSAWILIPAAAYQPGTVFITIFLTDGTTVTTLASVSTSVLIARTSNQVDPGSVITDWTQTINAAMQAVETAAENVAGLVADYYSALTYPVPLGKYCIYNNVLYRCISPIASSESWTAAHWTQVKLANEVSNLSNEISDVKSALDMDEEAIGGIIIDRQYSSSSSGKYDVYGGYYKSADGTTASSAKYKRTDKFTAFSGKPVKIKIGTGFEFSILFWDSTDTYQASKYIGYHSNKNGFVFYVEPGDKIALNIRKTDQTNISSAEEAQIEDTLETYTYFVQEELSRIKTNYLSLIYSEATVITATSENHADLNDFTTAGNYRINTATIAGYTEHIPITLAGRLIVMTTSGTDKLLQIYIANRSDGYTIFERSYSGSAWSDWFNMTNREISDAFAEEGDAWN